MRLLLFTHDITLTYTSVNVFPLLASCHYEFPLLGGVTQLRVYDDWLGVHTSRHSMCSHQPENALQYVEASECDSRLQCPIQLSLQGLSPCVKHLIRCHSVVIITPGTNSPTPLSQGFPQSDSHWSPSRDTAMDLERLRRSLRLPRPSVATHICA